MGGFSKKTKILLTVGFIIFFILGMVGAYLNSELTVKILSAIWYN